MSLSAFLTLSPWLFLPIIAMDMVTILSKIPEIPLEPYDEVMRKNNKTKTAKIDNFLVEMESYWR